MADEPVAAAGPVAGAILAMPAEPVAAVTVAEAERVDQEPFVGLRGRSFRRNATLRQVDDHRLDNYSCE